MYEIVDIYLARDGICDRCPIFTAITLFVHKFCELHQVKIHFIVVSMVLPILSKQFAIYFALFSKIK